MRPSPVLLAAALLLGCSSALTSTLARDEPRDDWAPTDEQETLAREIVDQLQRRHYRPLTFDDRLGGELLDRYLEVLDPARLYLMRADVEEYARESDRFDDWARAGELDQAFSIFERFQQRRLDRLAFALGLVDEELPAWTYDAPTTIDLDRTDDPWPVDAAASEALWRQRLKNEALGLRLAGSEPEDVARTLERRYRTLLQRVEQTNDADVFRIYMGVVTRGYDPHTEYFPPWEAEDFDIQMSLSFEGIGAMIGTDGEFCSISRIMPGGPAEQSGELRAGDRIAAVGQGEDGELVDVVGWRTDEVAEMIRGPAGSVVRLAIVPAEQADTTKRTIVTLTRNEVELEEQAAGRQVVEVERDGATHRVGVIRLPAFYIDFRAANAGDPDFRSSSRDVRHHLRDLLVEGVDGIVLDLRGNGGGSLYEAEVLTELFVGGGPIVQIQDAKGRVEVATSPRRRPAYTGPLAVLVNRLSASASEIFAAAVQDTGRGVVLGTRTFGKGTVQSMEPVEDGRLKFTNAKFYRISGASTQHRGVLPDLDFPALYDPEEIGESVYDEALPWDTIDAVPHRRSDTIAELRARLRLRHDERLAADPDWVALTQQLDAMRALREQTEASLDEEARRAERELVDERMLEIENARRRAHGLEPVSSLEESEDPDADALFTREAAAVLADMIELGGEGERTRWVAR